MAQVTKNYDVTVDTHHLTDNTTGALGKLAYVTLSEEFIVHSNDYLIPFHAIDYAVVVTTMDRPPTITGVGNVDIWEGEAFDPMAGVSATDKDGNPVPVTYTGTVDTTTPGDYWLTYSATDSIGMTATARRRVRVKELEAPHFTGIRNISVFQGAVIDLEEGVHAWLGSTEISYTYSPTSINECAVGTTTVTYSATGNGKTTTVDRTVEIKQADPPVISGNTPLYVYTNTDFDPLDGLTAVDANGNPVPVELDDNIFTLTKTIGSTNTAINYIEGTVVPLRKPVLTDRQRFDGWYDNSTMTGTPITEVTMTANKQVWCKITNTAVYASYDSSTDQFRIFMDDAGKYTNGQVVDTTTYYAGLESNTATPWSSATWKANVTSIKIETVFKPRGLINYFSGFSSCTQISGLWRIDTVNVLSAEGMFKDMSSITSAVDLSTFNTANITNMNSMFKNAGFRSIDISSFVANDNLRTDGMFDGCSALSTIYATDAMDMSGSTEPTSSMFRGCVNLVGGAGTTFDSSHTDGAYARVDGGSSRPGYYTER